MTSADVVLDYHLWKKKIKNPKIYIKKKLVKLNKLKLFKKKSKNHTIFLTNNKKMRELNKKFKNKNKTTDVLSFPFHNKINYKKNIYLGDIAISYEIINKRSKNSNFFLEFDKMWIHGYLHLLGHNHKKKKRLHKNEKARKFNIKLFL
jgi:probable rRNA maturation factor